MIAEAYGPALHHKKVFFPCWKREREKKKKFSLSTALFLHFGLNGAPCAEKLKNFLGKI